MAAIPFHIQLRRRAFKPSIVVPAADATAANTVSGSGRRPISRRKPIFYS